MFQRVGSHSGKWTVATNFDFPFRFTVFMP